MFKIEKGIPTPQGRVSKGSVAEALKQMKVGDSVLLESLGKAAAWHPAAYKLNFKIRTSVVGGGKVRVWRTA